MISLTSGGAVSNKVGRGRGGSVCTRMAAARDAMISLTLGAVSDEGLKKMFRRKGV